MKWSFVVIFMIIGAWMLAACTKTVHLDLNNAAPKLVIEGQVLNTRGPYKVQLTLTVNFSDPNKFPPVKGAKVSITDQTTGSTDHLTETASGIYSTHSLKGVPGHTYKMVVSVGTDMYTASSTMPDPIELDSLSFKKLNLFGNETFFAEVNFQDPADKDNYYTFVEYINGRQYNKATFTFDDRLSDGQYVSQQLFTDSAYIQPGDSITVKMHCVDKDVYHYFNTLEIAGNPEASTPANPVTNIKSKKSVLGYFSAQTVSILSAKNDR